MLKKDRIFSFGVPGCTNQEGRNSNMIELVTTIIMLLYLYNDIFRALVYFIPEPWHIENPVSYIK